MLCENKSVRKTKTANFCIRVSPELRQQIEHVISKSPEYDTITDFIRAAIHHLLSKEKLEIKEEKYE